MTINGIDVLPSDTSVIQKTLQGQDTMTLAFTLATYYEFAIGTTIQYNGTTYTMNVPASVKKIHTQHYDYTLTLEAPQGQLSKYKFRDFQEASLGRLDFHYTARPHEHLQMLVDNLNARDTGWAIGECIDATETLVTYSYTDCLSALKTIADTFRTEWEIVGKTISLHKVEYYKSDPLPLSYGQGAGFLTGVTRTSQTQPTNLLFSQGGERNILLSEYGSKILHFPKKQTIGFNGTYFEDETDYTTTNARVYIASDDGLYIRNFMHTPSASSVEESLDLTNIYPKRTGTITSVVIKNAAGYLVDIIDTSIPDTLNYNNYLMDEQTMTLIFESGMLAGKEFGCTYRHTDRTFLIVSQNIDGIPMPDTVDGTGYMPAVGDTYSLYGMNMPTEYIGNNNTKSGAEWDMFREAVRYLYEHEEQVFTFTGELDPIFANNNWSSIADYIRCGAYIRFQDTNMNEQVDIRVTGVTLYLTKPYSPKLELSNEVRQYLPGWLSKKEQQQGKDAADFADKIAEATKRPTTTAPRWVTISIDCRTDANDDNTGYAYITRQDLNPLSSQYLKTYVEQAYNIDYCPLPDMDNRTDFEFDITTNATNRQAGFDIVLNGTVVTSALGTIDWGDGTTTPVNSLPSGGGLISHTYTDNGTYSCRLIHGINFEQIKIHQFGAETYRLKGLASATITTLSNFALDVKGMIYDGEINCPMADDYAYAFSFGGIQADAPLHTSNFIIRGDNPNHTSILFYNAFSIGTAGVACLSYLSDIRIELASPCNLLTAFNGAFKSIGDTSTNGSGVAWINEFLSLNPAPYSTNSCFTNCERLYDFADIPSSWK
jgi:hypothetical protein